VHSITVVFEIFTTDSLAAHDCEGTFSQFEHQPSAFATAFENALESRELHLPDDFEFSIELTSREEGAVTSLPSTAGSSSGSSSGSGRGSGSGSGSADLLFTITSAGEQQAEAEEQGRISPALSPQATAVFGSGTTTTFTPAHAPVAPVLTPSFEPSIDDTGTGDSDLHHLHDTVGTASVEQLYEEVGVEDLWGSHSSSYADTVAADDTVASYATLNVLADITPSVPASYDHTHDAEDDMEGVELPTPLDVLVVDTAAVDAAYAKLLAEMNMQDNSGGSGSGGSGSAQLLLRAVGTMADRSNGSSGQDSSSEPGFAVIGTGAALVAVGAFVLLAIGMKRTALVRHTWGMARTPIADTAATIIPLGAADRLDGPTSRI
jgi:hypothetical protein